jgi:hypothetical protein
MLCIIGKERGLVLPPPPVSLQILAFLPPPQPPEGGKGGGELFTFYHITYS